MMEIKKGRGEVFEGMAIVHDLVAPTLGPNGENVVLDRGFSVPIISNGRRSYCTSHPSS